MIQIADIAASIELAEPEFDAPLKVNETASIVDSLFAMPDEGSLEAESGAVGRAVHDRLQARLAQKMRRLIEADEDRETDAGRRDAA